MSSNWVKDISDMQDHYGVREWVLDPKNKDRLMLFLDFRLDFLREELEETEAAHVSCDNEEIVDGLIDLCVVAIGTLMAFGVDAEKAWDVVLEANMTKQPGTKPERPNPLGLPDLMKPEGWKPPSHEDNHGDLPNNF
jgi:hypothetical protein